MPSVIECCLALELKESLLMAGSYGGGWELRIAKNRCNMHSEKMRNPPESHVSQLFEYGMVHAKDGAL